MRRQTHQHFSIEELFSNIYQHLQKRCPEVEKEEVPETTKGLKSVWKNISWIRKQKSDVVHVTGDVHYVLLGLIGRKTVLTIHDCVTVRGNMNVFKRWIFKKLWFDVPVKLAQKITVISEQTKSELIDLTGVSESKIEVIPNCVGSDFHESRYTFNQIKPRILQIGTKSNKNLPRVIEALRGTSCQLVIIGGLNEILKKQLEDAQIEFEQYSGLSKPDIIEQYQRADLVVFTSTYEGFGLPIIEGQATGRPVITSNLEPMQSVAGPGSCLVDPYSIESIRSAIQRIISDQDYRDEVIVNGLENVKKYKASEIAQRYFAVYQELAGE